LNAFCPKNQHGWETDAFLNAQTAGKMELELSLQSES